MTLANYQAVRRDRELIGDAVARVLKGLAAMHGEVKVVAIVPRILAPFRQSDHYSEVIEADIIVEHQP